jgi:5-methylthioadenosine/S-adenosylhomocysteine deaminase
MLFKNITILDENFMTRENMFVGIKGDTIDYIGSKQPIEDYGEDYDGQGKALMSGFFNAHAHTPMTLMRGYGENLALPDWLNKIFAFEDHLDKDAVYYGMLLGIAESLKYGIVSSTDMYYFCDDMARAILESGAKNNLGRGVVNFTGQDIYTMPGFLETKYLFESYHNTGNGRLRIDVSLHAEYTSNPDTARKLAEYAKEVGANMHVHVSETQSEHEECKQRHNGLTPAQYLNSMGIFDNKTTAAHCVWVEEQDIELFQAKGVTVASCPISNSKLASGVLNIPHLLSKGVNVAIGTDSAASNNNLNFMEDIKFFALINKGKEYNPKLITPQEALYAATFAGAKSQGRYDCGKLAKGFKADLIVVDLLQPNMRPIHNLASNMVYAASGNDIVLTMVDGKVLYKHGEYLTIDIEKTIFAVEKATNRILGELT